MSKVTKIGAVRSVLAKHKIEMGSHYYDRRRHDNKLKVIVGHSGLKKPKKIAKVCEEIKQAVPDCLGVELKTNCSYQYFDISTPIK